MEEEGGKQDRCNPAGDRGKESDGFAVCGEERERDTMQFREVWRERSLGAEIGLLPLPAHGGKRGEGLSTLKSQRSVTLSTFRAAEGVLVQ
jgi:hypothetical protein